MQFPFLYIYVYHTYTVLVVFLTSAKHRLAEFWICPQTSAGDARNCQVAASSYSRVVLKPNGLEFN